MIKVITLDDEQLALDNLNYILKKFAEIEVVLSTTAPAEVLDSLERLKPDLIFADISMPEINGMEISAKIRSRNRPRKKLVRRRVPHYRKSKRAILYHPSGGRTVY